MTAAPKQTLVERVAEAMRHAGVSDPTNEGGRYFPLDNHEAIELALVALDACHAEEAVALLRQMRKEYGMQFHTVCGQTLVAVDNLLAELDGQPSESAAMPEESLLNLCTALAEVVEGGRPYLGKMAALLRPHLRGFDVVNPLAGHPEEHVEALREAVAANNRRPAPYRTVMPRATALIAKLDGKPSGVRRVIGSDPPKKLVTEQYAEDCGLAADETTNPDGAGFLREVEP